MPTLESHTKNPLITKVFREMKWVEELGSGRKNILKYAPLYYEKYQIRIENGEKFVFDFTYRDTEEVDSSESCRGQVGTMIESSKTHVEKGSEQNRDYDGTMTGLCRDQVEQILEFCAEARHIQEIMSLLELKSRSKFREKYLRPLLDNDFLTMTIPNKPRNHFQKYITTPKGESELSAKNKSETKNSKL